MITGRFPVAVIVSLWSRSSFAFCCRIVVRSSGARLWGRQRQPSAITAQLAVTVCPQTPYQTENWTNYVDLLLLPTPSRDISNKINNSFFYVFMFICWYFFLLFSTSTLVLGNGKYWNKTIKIFAGLPFLNITNTTFAHIFST